MTRHQLHKPLQVQPENVGFWRLGGARQRDHWQEGESQDSKSWNIVSMGFDGMMIICFLGCGLLISFVSSETCRWQRLWILRSCKSIETFSHFLTGCFGICAWMPFVENTWQGWRRKYWRRGAGQGDEDIWVGSKGGRTKGLWKEDNLKFVCLWKPPEEKKTISLIP